jgi:hypothetical protein
MSSDRDIEAASGRRRLAAKLCRHAAAVLPDASPWAQAMRCELDYITDDGAALDWAFGCLLASYRTVLTARAAAGLGRLRRFFLARNPALLLRHAALSCALMLAIGLALLDNAGGQTPPPPVLDETACDRADKGADLDPDLRGRTLPSAVQTTETSCPGRPARDFRRVHRVLPHDGNP